MKKLILICLLCLVAQAAIAEEIKENDAWKIERIDSATFYAAKKRVNPKPQTRRKITDPQQLKKLLAPRGFKFNDWSDEWNGKTYNYTQVIYPAKGKFYKKWLEELGPDLWLYGFGTDPDREILCLGDSFDSYFPDLDILTVNAGDFADSYNFRTGESGYDIGDPIMWLDSPSGEYRLNGMYNGAGGDYDYYLQKRIAPERYQPIGFLPFCTPPKSFWDGERVLYLINKIPEEWLEEIKDNPERLEAYKDKFYRLTIK